MFRDGHVLGTHGAWRGLDSLRSAGHGRDEDCGDERVRMREDRLLARLDRDQEKLLR